MAHYNATKIFPEAGVIYNNPAKTALLIVDANSGSITLQADSNGNWITEQVFTADSTRRVAVGGAQWRVLVSGDAEYDWSV